jgi:hypothetical protein
LVCFLDSATDGLEKIEEALILYDVSQLTEWKLVCAFNVLIELALFAMPVWLVWGLQTSIGRKITVVSVFGLRLP